MCRHASAEVEHIQRTLTYKGVEQRGNSGGILKKLWTGRLGNRGSTSGGVQEIFIFSTMCSLALGLTRSLFQWGRVFLGSLFAIEVRILFQLSVLYWNVQNFWCTVLVWPASWSSGQSLWLLIMRSRVRFPALPWEFSLKEKIPAVTMAWVD